MSEESTSSNPTGNPQAEEPQPPEKLVPSTIFGTAATARSLANSFFVSSSVPPEKPEAEVSPQKIRRGSIWA